MNATPEPTPSQPQQGHAAFHPYTPSPAASHCKACEALRPIVVTWPAGGESQGAFREMREDSERLRRLEFVIALAIICAALVWAKLRDEGKL